MRFVSILVVFLLFVAPSKGQAIRYDLMELAQQKKIKTFNRVLSVASDGNIKGIHLSAHENDGVAWVEGLEFADGTSELDIKGKDVLQQSFLGVAFHGADEKILDVVYFRPFNFRATDSVRRIHAVQYVSHPDFPWPTLREKFNGKYEKAIIPPPDPNTWFHVKIVVAYPNVTVFVNGNSKPSLTVEQLSKRKTGKLGVWVGNGSDGDFANLVIQKMK